jgi:hypothetical protein
MVALDELGEATQVLTSVLIITTTVAEQALRNPVGRWDAVL